MSITGTRSIPATFEIAASVSGWFQALYVNSAFLVDDRVSFVSF